VPKFIAGVMRRLVSLEGVMRRRLLELYLGTGQLLVFLGVLGLFPLEGMMRRRLVELCSDMEQLLISCGVLFTCGMLSM
jgi:hypothetical protein